jgi:ATP-dependent 26S proteasome regulatory subunit
MQEDIRLRLRARTTLIVLVTVEEERAVQLLDEVRRERVDADLVTWDVAGRFASRAGRQLPDAATPGAALDKIRDQVGKFPDRRDIYVLEDFHEYWGRDPSVRRQLRNLAHSLKFTMASLVVTTPKRDVPQELANDVVVLELPLPTEHELRDELDLIVMTTMKDALARGTGGWRNELSDEGQAKVAQAALGLTMEQARRAFSKAIVQHDVLDERAIDTVVQEKKAVIRESQALEFYAAGETPDDVGGLEVLKRWLTLRERAFGEEAADYGLPPPKGLALIGIPGTGKSLTAKMIGGLWHLPLLRLDVGALFGSLVGESEERIRHALRLAETVAPCVLWIDEIEKAFAAGDLDGGTSQRVFGTLLTWMQEKTDPVFVVATANDVTALPPEALRRGRFDEIFFLDLPAEDERRAIISVHLRKRRREPGSFDIHALAKVTDGYTGAEIAHAIVDAMYHAFNDGRDLETADIVNAVDRTVPLSRSQREVIERLRSWLRERRAVSASFTEVAEAERRQVRLELD